MTLNKQPSKQALGKRMFRALVKSLEWFSFRSDGALFEEDLFPRRNGRPTLLDADLTEEQRKRAIAQIKQEQAVRRAKGK